METWTPDVYLNGTFVGSPTLQCEDPLDAFNLLDVEAAYAGTRPMEASGYLTIGQDQDTPPDQFRGSATFRLASVVSSQPMMCTMVPLGSSGAWSSS